MTDQGITELVTTLNGRIITLEKELNAIAQGTQQGFENLSHGLTGLNMTAMVNGARINVLEKLAMENGKTEEELKLAYEVEVKKLQEAQAEMYKKYQEEANAKMAAAQPVNEEDAPFGLDEGVELVEEL